MVNFWGLSLALLFFQTELNSHVHIHHGNINHVKYILLQGIYTRNQNQNRDWTVVSLAQKVYLIEQ